MENAIQILKNKKYLNIEEACSLLCISKMTLHKLEKQGHIKSIKYKIRKYYSEEELIKYLEMVIE